MILPIAKFSTFHPQNSYFYKVCSQTKKVLQLLTQYKGEEENGTDSGL